MIVGEYDSIISGTVLLVNESVRRCSSASRVGNGPQQRVELERARDATVHVRQRPDAGRLGVLGLVERGVADRDGGLLGQELERRGFVAAERALGPVMNDQRAEDPILHRERRRGGGLEAFALDFAAARGREPEPRVGQDVARARGAAVAHRHADRTAPDRNRAPARILRAQTTGRTHHAELGRRRIPQHHHRRLGAHDLERLVDDRVEHLVEIARRSERLADGFHRQQQQGMPLLVADVAEERDGAGDAAVAFTPRDAARLEPHDPIVAGHRVRELDRVGCLPGESAADQRDQGRVAEQGQHGRGAAPDGVRRPDAGEALHGRVPLDDFEGGIEDDERFVEVVEESFDDLVLLWNARHPPSMNGPPGPMQ
jgi:hypothetical protein